MKVYFVIDIKSGKVVAARKGERESYVPIELRSNIVSTSDPIRVVESISPRYLYAADLDRIMGTGSNTGILGSLQAIVEEMIADCGFRRPEELESLPFTPVVGTETFDITKLHRKCYVSLDFKGDFIDASKRFCGWREAVEFLNTLDLMGIIVLTIHAVGTMHPDFDTLEKVMDVSDHPVLLGGGIGDVRDMDKAKEIGCSGVLIATAVHSGKIPVEIVRKGKY